MFLLCDIQPDDDMRSISILYYNGTFLEALFPYIGQLPGTVGVFASSYLFLLAMLTASRSSVSDHPWMDCQEIFYRYLQKPQVTFALAPQYMVIVDIFGCY